MFFWKKMIRFADNFLNFMNLKKIIAFIFYVTYNAAFSQELTKLSNFENSEYSISYPSSLSFEELKNSNVLLNTNFVISNKSDVEFNFPFIALTITNCSGLGMGTVGIIKSMEKEKKVAKRISQNGTDFDELTSENDGITTYEYVFVKNYKDYFLYSLTPTKLFNEKKTILENIMNTFELK
jgi:hypothetical protein